ncbi:MAG: serine--tRNA ligase, partial [Alphaproteobacteria bacterium]|nr:serine--tRNA ligase [Alphaproteobacteria bacterium]
MHDIRMIRADGAGFDAACARRDLAQAAPAILGKDAARRAAQTALQEKQARRNALAKEIGQGKRSGADTSALEAEATALRDQMAALEAEAAALDKDIFDTLAAIPNLLDPDVPDGADEHSNVEIKRWGTPREMGFTPK